MIATYKRGERLALLATGCIYATIVFVSVAFSQTSQRNSRPADVELEQLQKEIQNQRHLEESSRDINELHKKINQALGDIQAIRDAVKHVDDVVRKKGCTVVPRLAKELAGTVFNSQEALTVTKLRCSRIGAQQLKAETDHCRAQEQILNGRLKKLQDEYASLLATCEYQTQ